MIIRDAIPKDVPAICRIWNDVIQNSNATFTTDLKTPGTLLKSVQSREVFIVAEHDGALLGFVTSTQFRPSPGYQKTHELSIHLDPNARGKGTGKTLIVALEKRLRAQGVHVLIAGISAENHAGLKLHAALGFVEVGRLAEVGFKSGNFIDLIFMQKKL